MPNPWLRLGLESQHQNFLGVESRNRVHDPGLEIFHQRTNQSCFIEIGF
jgi:hypothetical protein